MSSDKKNPSTGSGRDRDDEKPEATEASGSPESAEQSTETADATDETIEATPEPDIDDVAVETETLSEEDAALLDLAAVDLVAEMRSDMLRAQAELVNFRTRVERDRVANRESVIAEVIRSLLPAIDDLTRAEKHGDLEGSPLELVAAKIRSTFERYGLRSVGEKGEVFDPHFHEAVVQLPTPGATEQTVADVIDPGYALGERLIRAAKVAVSVPE
ncbi:molecular chaperone GrpE [Conyzicola nivalis]|uniref:Protein GrpE n=1 Tax=Conyzicola nivalis TaxID=1477021 RepID=A0ABV2QTH1_9MICO